MDRKTQIEVQSKALSNANKVVNQFDYLDLLSHKPRLVKNGLLNNGIETTILDIIVDVGNAVVMSEITGAVSRLLHPSEYNYTKEILTKVDAIEKNLEKLTQITQLIAYQNVIGERREILIGLSTITNAYFEQYCDAIINQQDETALNAIVEEWATKICNGTNIYYVVETLLKLYLNNNVMLDKSYPDIYDEIAYASYPWQSRSYAFRELLREEDEYVVMSSLVLTQAYFTIHKDEYHLEELARLSKEYKTFMENNPAELSPNPVCQIPGAEITFERTWTVVNWVNRLQIAKDNEWNLKDGNVRNRVYYENTPEKYPLADALWSIQNYYGGQPLFIALDDATLIVDKTALSGFTAIPQNSHYVVQGRYDWELKNWTKNKDKFIVQALPMFGQKINSTNQIVCEECNFSSGIIPPQEYNPPLKCTNPGHSVKDCGLFKIVKTGR